VRFETMTATMQQRPTTATGRLVISNGAIAAMAATFALMGVLAAAYGPLLEHLTHRFAISLPVAGASLSVHFAGALLGVLVSMRAMEKVSGRATVSAGSGCLGVGCAVVALAPTWPAFLVGVFLIGLGWGTLVIGLNQLVAHSEGPRRSALLNALNGAYSAGAVASPLLVATLAQAHMSLLYAGAVVIAVALIPAAAGISGRLPIAGGTSIARPALLIGIFVCAFALYVGTESGTGGWMTSHLESLQVRSQTAAVLTSGFWLALAAGRLLVTLVPARVPEAAIVLTGSGAAAVFLLAAWIGIATPLAYVLTGLALAPIFPTGIVWLARLRPGDSRATSWLFPAAMAGGVAGPGAIGIVVANYGVGWAPLALALVAAGCMSAFLLASRTVQAAAA
jgi:MFS transporter, FHS family, glucose/mannose:H+ symporter